MHSSATSCKASSAGDNFFPAVEKDIEFDNPLLNSASLDEIAEFFALRNELHTEVDELNDRAGDAERREWIKNHRTVSPSAT